MKLKNASITVLSLVALLIFSCNDDKANDPVVVTSAGSFTLQSQSTEIENALFVYDYKPGKSSKDEVIYHNELAFIDEGFTINFPLRLGAPLVEGSGNAIGFGLICDSPELRPGTYNYSAEGDSGSPFSIYYGSIYLGETVFDFVSCTIEVVERDGIYSIAFEGVVTDDEGLSTHKVEGHYDGAVVKVNDKEADDAQNYVMQYAFEDQNVSGKFQDNDVTLFDGYVKTQPNWNVITLSATDTNCDLSFSQDGDVDIYIDSDLNEKVYNPVMVSFKSNAFQINYGVVEIVSITEGVISGRVYAKMDDSNFINGNFTVEICKM